MNENNEKDILTGMKITYYDIQVKEKNTWKFLNLDLDLGELKDELKAIAVVEDAPLRIIKIETIYSMEGVILDQKTKILHKIN